MSSIGSTDLFHLVEVGGSKPLVSVKEEDFGGMLRITTGKAEVFSGRSQLSQVSSWTAIRTGHLWNRRIFNLSWLKVRSELIFKLETRSQFWPFHFLDWVKMSTYFLLTGNFRENEESILINFYSHWGLVASIMSAVARRGISELYWKSQGPVGIQMSIRNGRWSF